MPYVPRDDRPMLDAAAEEAAVEMAKRIEPGKNFQLVKEYKRLFIKVSNELYVLELNRGRNCATMSRLAERIHDAGNKHGYEGAFLGELNFAFTRFLQHLPRAVVATGKWKNTDELRYWLYACAIEALIVTSDETKKYEMGIGGVWVDIKDELKWRVNRPYETAQILKSGDCYDAPHYNRLVEVVDHAGNIVGHVYVDLVRPPSYKKDGKVHPDVLAGKLVLSGTEGGKKS